MLKHEHYSKDFSDWKDATGNNNPQDYYDQIVAPEIRKMTESVHVRAKDACFSELLNDNLWLVSDHVGHEFIAFPHIFGGWQVWASYDSFMAVCWKSGPQQRTDIFPIRHITDDEFANIIFCV